MEADLRKLVEPPPPAQPRAGGDWFPHIIQHDVQADGTVLVTWALPGLHTATVRVPWGEWCEGEHAPTGSFLSAFIAPLLVDPRQAPRNPTDKQDAK